jgi:glutamine synthetase
MPPKTTAEILATLQSNNTKSVKLAITDLDGVLRGKMVSFQKFTTMVEQGFGFCDIVFAWDVNDVAYDNLPFTGWDTGFPDATATIDLGTLRNIPWEAGLPLVLADFSQYERAASLCPRSLLKRTIAQLADAGYVAKMAQEFEWFNFVPTTENPYATLSQGMFGYSLLRASQHSAYFQQLFAQLAEFGVPVEGLHTETGPGVYEAAIAYTSVLEAADRAVLFKTGVKEIAHRHGIKASFMAKWNEKLPGCSGHLHQSLWSADGEANVFYDANTDSNISATLEQYMAGQLYCLPHILPMLAPNVNSYKRLVEGAWAPTTLTWGIDNRTTALRAIPGSRSSTRLETRVPGSDCNPYLARAACLASGLYGITNGLTLQEVTTGNGYAETNYGRLPKNLPEAALRMQQSELAKAMFGEAFVAHFTATRLAEWQQFSNVVTDWELRRYFEII